MCSEPVRIQLFGGLRATRGGQDIPLSLARAPRLGVLLALLALPQTRDTGSTPDAPRRRRFTRRNVILELWPEEGDSSAARTRLRTLLVALRRKIEPTPIPSGSVLVAVGETLFLTESIEVDVDVFLDALACVGQETDSQAQARGLANALGQIRGLLLPDRGEAWVVAARQEMADAVLEALTRTAGALEAAVTADASEAETARRLAQSVNLYARFLAPLAPEPPWHDRLHGVLMRLYLLARQPAQALREYETLAARLAEGQAPPSLEVVRLRGLARQASLARHPGRSPAPLFGREHDLAALTRMLAAMPALVVLSGPPGAGKTCLARASLRLLRDVFGPAVCLVRLQDLTHGAMIPRAILHGLAVACAGQDAFEEAAQALSVTPTLLVLDNLEHLLGEGRGGAEMVRALLRRVPTLTCLVTSRKRLPPGPQPDIREAEFRLPPLRVPAETASWEELQANPCVRLFAERARQADPDFALTRRNAPDVGRLCRLLDGLPLALVLVAEWVRTHTPARIGREIGCIVKEASPRRRAGTKSGSMGTGDAGYATLQAALQWSYGLLDADTARLFTRLSVFRGGWTLAALDAVCAERDADGSAGAVGEAAERQAADTEDVVAGLARLLDASLVEAEDAGGERRFTLLATLRAFGAEQLDAEAEQALARRHADYFRQFAEEAAPHLLGAAQGEWLDRLEAEQANFLAALDTCTRIAGQGEAGGRAMAQTGLRLCAALARFWWTRGYVGVGSRQCAAVLALAAAQTGTKARGDALYGASVLAWMQGDYPAARPLLETCLTLRQGLGDTRGCGAVLNSLGILAKRQGDYPAARRLLEQCLAYMQTAEDRQGLAACYGNLGNVAKEQGDYAAACTLHAQSLALSRALGDLGGAAVSLNNLAIACKAQGKYAHARTLYEESLEIRRDLGDRQGIADTLSNLGNVAEEQGDYAVARALHEQSLAIHEQIGNLSGIATALNNLANVVWRQGDCETARTLHLRGLDQKRALGEKASITIALGNLGQLACEQGEHAQALAYWAECLPLAHEIGDQETLAAALEGCMKLALCCGQTLPAVRLHAFAYGLRTFLDVPQPPNQRAQYEQDVRQLQSLLSAPVFAQAYAAGTNSSVEETLALALGLQAHLVPTA